jgi:ectoine hydroxylase-related dioxygenase (phytanoyl-CoA dioxygenase family)
LNIFFFKDKISISNYYLEKDGVCVISNVLVNSEINKMRELCSSGNYKKIKEYLLEHPILKKECFKKTGENYIFQDYIWIIQKSVVHTCHRDNNGDFFNNGQKFPSYTVIIYLEPMEKCLGIIPKSHLEKYSYSFNITDPIMNLRCSPGDVIIFNANLIHVGAMNKHDNHLRCQLKLSHIEDIHLLGYYQNFNKVLNQDNKMPGFVRHIQKRWSCATPFFSDLTQSENIRTARGSDNGINIGFFQKIFSYLFYGNKDFYDLPNAF